MSAEKYYAYRVIWSQDDQAHVGLCAEFPSLSWIADTPEKALKGIRKVVADTLDDMTSTGETAPEPFSKRRFSGKFQVRIPPDTHRELSLHAAEQGVSLNRYVSAKLAARDRTIR